MTLFSRCMVLGTGIFAALALCACGEQPINPTVITKAPQDVVMRTETTTTVATTVDTAGPLASPTHLTKEMVAMVVSRMLTMLLPTRMVDSRRS